LLLGEYITNFHSSIAFSISSLYSFSWLYTTFSSSKSSSSEFITSVSFHNQVITSGSSTTFSISTAGSIVISSSCLLVFLMFLTSKLRSSFNTFSISGEIFSSTHKGKKT